MSSYYEEKIPMTNTYNLDLGDVLSTYLPAGLTCISFFWILYKYLKQESKNIGFTLIFILSISDFTLSTVGILSGLYPMVRLKYVYQTLFYLTIHFSIFWAAIMAFIVYKSLQDREVDIKRFCIKMIFITFVAASMFTIMWDTIHFGDTSRINRNSPWFLLLTVPLFLALLSMFMFYSRSTKLLKAQSEFVQKSTSRYIQNLRVYSVVQFLTYGPIILNFYIMLGFIDVTGKGRLLWLNIFTAISYMSGFFNSLIFISQGPVNHSINEMEQLDLDLTKNETFV